MKKYNDILSEKEKQQIIVDYVQNGLSIRGVAKKYNISSHSWISKLLKGKTRNLHESIKLFITQNPEVRKTCVTEHTRSVIREHRLKYMKEHPEETAWRKRNLPSYPESCFIKFLTEKGYDKKFLIEREFAIFPFYIDFAFVDLKIAVEIDGSQHLEPERKKRDEEKDKLLLKEGWKILRLTDEAVKKEWEQIEISLNKLIGSNDIKFEKVGIIKKPKGYIKKERGADGLTDKERESHYNSRKVKERPNAETLKQLLEKNSFTAVGKQYGVSTATIRRWCRKYNIPFHFKDYKK